MNGVTTHPLVIREACEDGHGAQVEVKCVLVESSRLTTAAQETSGSLPNQLYFVFSA